MATNKFGNSQDRTYIISEMNIEMKITPQQITVKYKGKQVTPSMMKNHIIR